MLKIFTVLIYISTD